MLVINARNVNDALGKGVEQMLTHGVPTPSRAGPTLEISEPVATVYERPWERVLINPVRDANPFFHLMEALWILAGREDVKFLTEFNKRMADYSDDGSTFNAAYGYRLANATDWGQCDMNQLYAVTRILRQDPMSRQAVCQIWDTADLTRDTKDKACNMSIVFRIRNGKLCMTVYNRSNDMIWGAYGANMVQFSMIQEYVAAKLDLPMGEYTQVSNSFHVYTEGPGGEVWDRVICNFDLHNNPYDRVNNHVTMTQREIGAFDRDLALFFNVYDSHGLKEILFTDCWESGYFKRLVLPMLDCFVNYKELGAHYGLDLIQHIEADDWRIACEQWLMKRKV